MPGLQAGDQEYNPAMLQRYQMHRRQPANVPLPDGIRKDTRRHTHHCLRPPREAVDAYLANPTQAAWRKLAAAYNKALADRFAKDPKPFKELADLAVQQDVYIGCSCPTKKNPDVRHCHTWLALEFMKKKFSGLTVVFPKV